jgi:hypothetical protein
VVLYTLFHPSLRRQADPEPEGEPSVEEPIDAVPGGAVPGGGVPGGAVPDGADEALVKTAGVTTEVGEATPSTGVPATRAFPTGNL